MKSIVYLLWLSFPELSFSLPIGLVDSLLDGIAMQVADIDRLVGKTGNRPSDGPGLIDPEPPFLRPVGMSSLGSSGLEHL